MNDYVFILIVLSIFIIIIMAWYYNPNAWHKLSFSKGELVTIPIPEGKGIYSLRFRKCIFNVTNGSQVLINGDVSGVLNDVARGYSKSSCEKYSIKPTELTLPAPLNSFLFQFPANMAKDVRDANGVPKSPWCTAGLTGCSTDSDCASKSLGACVIDSAPNNSGCASISPPSVTDPSTNQQICYTDPDTGQSMWVNPSTFSFPKQCQLCANDLTVTLDIQYRYI